MVQIYGLFVCLKKFILKPEDSIMKASKIFYVFLLAASAAISQSLYAYQLTEQSQKTAKKEAAAEAPAEQPTPASPAQAKPLIAGLQISLGSDNKTAANATPADGSGGGSAAKTSAGGGGSGAGKAMTNTAKEGKNAICNTADRDVGKVRCCVTSYANTGKDREKCCNALSFKEDKKIWLDICKRIVCKGKGNEFDCKYPD
jgi:hypothetical protein